MITKKQRNLVMWMVKVGMWDCVTVLRQPHIKACYGTKWLLRRLLNKQVVDNLHHAPCCPANHFHNSRLVFQECDCGAK